MILATMTSLLAGTYHPCLASFGRDHARQLAHRWRPISHQEVINGELVAARNDELRRYTRALDALERHNNSFGVVSHSEDYLLDFFVLHGEEKRYILDAILWYPKGSTSHRKVALRDMRNWHLLHFGGEVDMGPALERDDLKLGS